MISHGHYQWRETLRVGINVGAARNERLQRLCLAAACGMVYRRVPKVVGAHDINAILVHEYVDYHCAAVTCSSA